MEKLIKETTEKLINGTITKDDSDKILFGLFSIMTRSYGIVRWYDNEYEDVVCVDKATAEDYVRKYNKLAGCTKCYVDKDIWLPFCEVNTSERQFNIPDVKNQICQKCGCKHNLKIVKLCPKCLNDYYEQTVL
jgi:hypothetical protein